MRSRARKRNRRAIGRYQRRPGAPRSSERWGTVSGWSPGSGGGGGGDGPTVDALVHRTEDDSLTNRREGRPRANAASREWLLHRLLITAFIGCQLLLFSGVIAQDLMLSPLQLNTMNSWQDMWTDTTNSALLPIQVSPSSVRPVKINHSRHFLIYPNLGFKEQLVLLNHALMRMNSSLADNSVSVSPPSVRPIRIETSTINAVEEDLEEELKSLVVSSNAISSTSSPKRKRENSAKEIKAAFPKIINVGLHVNPQNHRPKMGKWKEKKLFGPKAFLWDYLHRGVPSSTQVQEKDKVQVSPVNLRPLQLQPLQKVEELWTPTQQSITQDSKNLKFRLVSEEKPEAKQERNRTELDTRYFDPFDELFNYQDRSSEQIAEQHETKNGNIKPSPTWKSIRGQVLKNDVTSTESDNFPPYPIAATAASFFNLENDYKIPRTNVSLHSQSEAVGDSHSQKATPEPTTSAENESTPGTFLQMPIPIRIHTSSKKESSEEMTPSSLSSDLMSLLLDQSNKTLNSEEQQVFDDIFPSENRSQEFAGDALSIPPEILLAFGEDLEESNSTTSISDNEVTPSSEETSKWTFSQVDPTGRGVRSRRDVLLLYNLVSCATGCNPIKYISYGCYCGFMGAGIPVDGIDRCCMMHDWCYDHLPCPQHMLYFIPYKWTCQLGRAQCHGRNSNWNHPSNCAFRMCECDRVFSECLRNQPCPKRKALCRSSAWRFLKNLLLGLGVAG